MRSSGIEHLLKPRPRKYRNLVKHLSDYLFITDDEDNGFSQNEIFHDLSSSRGTSRFLGYYSTRGIDLGLKIFGIYDKLDKLGLSKPEIQLDTSDTFVHKLTLLHTVQNKQIPSAELCLRRAPITLPDQVHTKTDCLVVEWFLLQNPIKPFTRRRPQLPGQDYPGSGLSMIIFEILYWMARRFNLDGVLLVPNYLHTGILYGRQCAFLDPARQGQLLSLTDSLHNVPLDQLSWACAEGQLLEHKSDVIYTWIPAPVVQPVSRKLKDWFFNPNYSKIMRETKTNFSVRIRPGYKQEYDANWKAI